MVSELNEYVQKNIQDIFTQSPWHLTKIGTYCISVTQECDEQ